MVRRGQQRKRDLVKAQKHAENQIDDVRGSYVPPDREDCQMRSFTSELGREGLLRLQVNFWRRGGSTTEFVLILQVREWDQWKNGPRVDCCHGVCHLHKEDGEPMSETYKTLDTVEDVQEAWKIADVEIRKFAATILSREED